VYKVLVDVHSEEKMRRKVVTIKVCLFKDVVTLLAKYDPLLKPHLEVGPKNATYRSNTIQNDLIISISRASINQLKRKIEN